MNRLYSSILEKKDDSQIPILSSFFKTGKGQYGEGDKFLGVKVPVTRKVVRENWKYITLKDIEECISSEYHEVRLSALLSLIELYKHSKDQKQYIDFYLSHTNQINNWDLVDLSCYHLLGNWLLFRPRDILYRLTDGTLWERRIAIVSTMAFIRKGDLDDCYRIAEIFLKDKHLHDLLQKATGWLLREAAKRDPERFLKWIDKNKYAMPRTMLRYSIEKFPKDIRDKIL